MYCHGLMARKKFSYGWWEEKIEEVRYMRVVQRS